MQILNCLPCCDNRDLGNPRVRVIRPGNRASSLKSSKWSREIAKIGGGKPLHSWPGAHLEVFVIGPKAVSFLLTLKTFRTQKANTLCFWPRFDFGETWPKSSRLVLGKGIARSFSVWGILQQVHGNHCSSMWGNVNSLQGLKVALHSHSLLSAFPRLRRENESSLSPKCLRAAGEGLRGHHKASVAWRGVALVWGECEELHVVYID